MDNETIPELWTKYIVSVFENSKIISKIPDIFQGPHCATCTHWELFVKDESDTIRSSVLPDTKVSKASDYELMFLSMKDIVPRRYDDHKFFGFCRRYPPVLHDYSPVVIKIGPMDKFKRLIFEYRFPITDQKQWCGEWKRGAQYWCKKEFMNKMCGEGEPSEILHSIFEEEVDAFCKD